MINIEQIDDNTIEFRFNPSADIDTIIDVFSPLFKGSFEICRENGTSVQDEEYIFHGFVVGTLKKY